MELETQNPRIQVIERLQQQFTHVDYRQLAELELLEKTQPTFMPTIGAEIEIPWSARFPKIAGRWFFDGKSWRDFSDEQKQQFDDVCNQLDGEVLPIYEAIQRAGVPKGHDAFWEFAHAPARWHQTIATEIETLFDAPGVLPEQAELPLHITLGGLRGGSGACLLLSIIEMNGGTTGDRVRKAIKHGADAVDRSWARKAGEGLYERAPSELVGGGLGIEMRSLVANSPEQTTQTLRTAHYIGTLLMGFRAYKLDCELAPRDLYDGWRKLVIGLKDSFSYTDIPINQIWEPPYESDEPWTKLADFLDWDYHPDVHAEACAYIEAAEEKASDYLSRHVTSGII